MNVLAFDTSFGAVSVAVRYRSRRNEWLLREDYEERETGHAEAIMPMIARVMVGANLTFEALDRIAVTHGPGSFTGVRIGVSAARGLALASGVPVAAMSSLAVMAFRADQLLGARPPEQPLAVCVDARKGQIYAQVFGDNAGDPLTEPLLSEPGAIVDYATRAGLRVVGSGGALVATAAARLQCDGIEVELERLQPHARHLALMAPALPLNDNVMPLYMRPPDAKPQTGGAVLADR